MWRSRLALRIFSKSVIGVVTASIAILSPPLGLANSPANVGLIGYQSPPATSNVRIYKPSFDEVMEAEDLFDQGNSSGFVVKSPEGQRVWLRMAGAKLWGTFTTNVRYVAIQFGASDFNDGLVDIKIDGVTRVNDIDTWDQGWWFVEIDNLSVSQHSVEIIAAGISAGSGDDDVSIDAIAGVNQPPFLDGGFESEPLTELQSYVAPEPHSFRHWTTNRGFGGGTATLVTEPAHSGNLAAQIDTLGASYGRLIFQDFGVTSTCYVMEFWIYPSEGMNSVGLLRDWKRSGSGTYASRANFDQVAGSEDRFVMSFAGWGLSDPGSEVDLRTGHWHKVAILAMGADGVQGLFAQNSPEAKMREISILEDATAIVVPDMLLFGDFSGTAYEGRFTYDDFAFQPVLCTNDYDTDGLTDSQEMLVFRTNAAWPDTDGDGLTDGDEVNGVQSPKPELGTFITEPLDPDTDDDGCTDGQELGSDETLGGRRNPTNPWDFFDPTGPEGVPDQYIDLFNDIQGVIDRYTAGGGVYDPAFDRGPRKAPNLNLWNLGPPDGHIDLFNDILGVISQYQHDCRP